MKRGGGYPGVAPGAFRAVSRVLGEGDVTQRRRRGESEDRGGPDAAPGNWGEVP